MSEDFYTILGVDQNATDEDLKNARRRLAAKYHPDRGGDAEKMSAVNEAYEVLSDPQRRLGYNGSGKTEPISSIEEIARDVFLQTLRSSIEAPDGCLDTAVRSSIASMREQVTTGRAKLLESQALLTKRRGQVTVDEGKVNFVHEIIDIKLKTIEGNLANCEESLKVTDLVEKMWSHYRIYESSSSFFSYGSRSNRLFGLED